MVNLAHYIVFMKMIYGHAIMVNGWIFKSILICFKLCETHFIILTCAWMSFQKQCKEQLRYVDDES